MMKYQAPFPSKYHFLRLLCAQLPELHVSSNIVQWQHLRFLGTEAARDIPNVDRSRRRIPKEERKNMVITYVNKYRMMNGGKFPTASVTVKEVGGSYNTIKLILQELEYDSKLSTKEATYKNTMVMQTAGVNGTSAEDGSSSQERVENDSVQRVIDMPVHMTKNSKTSSNDISGSERMIDLERQRECVKASVSDTGKYMKSGQVFESETPSLVEQTSVDEAIKATTVKSSENPGRPGHTSEVHGACKTKEPEEIAMASSQASESKDVSECYRMNELEIQGGRANTSVADADKFVSSGQVAETETPCLLEQTLVDKTSNATTAKKSENPPRPGHASEVRSECRTKELGEIAFPSSQASESKDVSGSQTMINLKLQKDCLKASVANADIVVASGKVSETEIQTPSLVGQTPVAEVIKGTAMKDSEIPVSPGHASEVLGTCKTKELGETDKASSSQAEKTEQKPPTSSLWGNLKSFASNVINSWKKT